MYGGNVRGRIKAIFTGEKVLLASRIILGSIFIAASVGKLFNPDQFTTLVASYNILPYGLSTVYGYLVPWIELFIGTFLILGLFTRFVSALSIPIIISFIIANSFKLLIGAGGSCGCFGDVIPLTLPQSLNIDALMLLLTIPLIVRKTRLLSVGHWLTASEHYRLKRDGLLSSVPVKFWPSSLLSPYCCLLLRKLHRRPKSVVPKYLLAMYH